MSKNIVFTCIFLFVINEVISQKIIALPSGKITTIANQTMKFSNLTIENEEVSFTNIKTNSTFFYLLNAIKSIEDENGKSIYIDERFNLLDENLIDKEIKSNVEEPNPFLNNDTEDSFEKTIKEEKKKYLNYPSGIYKTKEDFINKKPSDSSDIYAKELYGFEKSILTSIEDKCFFYYYDSDRKIKNVFAVSYQENLFFPIKTILNNRNKTDRAQTNDNPNSFVRVTNYGANYLYMEATLVNQWAQGFAYSANIYIAESLKNEKGIVWDIKNSEFNIFKNCNDYNEFIQEKYPEGVQECENHQPNIIEVRKAINIIK